MTSNTAPLNSRDPQIERGGLSAPLLHAILNKLAAVHAGICACALRVPGTDGAQGILTPKELSEELRGLADAVRDVSALVNSTCARPGQERP